MPQNKWTHSPASNFKKTHTTEMLRKNSIDFVFDKNLYAINAAIALIYSPL